MFYAQHSVIIIFFSLSLVLEYYPVSSDLEFKPFTCHAPLIFIPSSVPVSNTLFQYSYNQYRTFTKITS